MYVKDEKKRFNLNTLESWQTASLGYSLNLQEQHTQKNTKKGEQKQCG